MDIQDPNLSDVIPQDQHHASLYQLQIYDQQYRQNNDQGKPAAECE
jgi:hypothetical protein